MAAVQPTNPVPFLATLEQQRVIVALKWGTMEYRGTLVSSDAYMNFRLAEAEEWVRYVYLC